jgi:outer membrane protein assembly factor BamB
MIRLDGIRPPAGSTTWRPEGGVLYCLDPFTGKILWHNPMKGYGIATPTALVSVRGQSGNTLVEQLTAMQQAAVASATP